jgi:hypothetical protein
MIESTANFMRPFLDFSPIRRIRRNHGLEHATIHVLTGRDKHKSMAGRAVVNGFFLYGNLDTQDVATAANEAIERMRKGEHSLAVHPNCGTGLVTAGFFTSIAAFLSTMGASRNWIDRASRIPTMVLFSIIALIVSQPTSLSLQAHITTLGDPGNLEIVDITRRQIRMPWMRKPLTVHRVWTKKG